MKKSILIIFLFLLNFISFSQENNPVYDPEARKILDNLSIKLAKFQTGRINFEYSIYNAQDSSKQTYLGYLFMKGTNKFKIIIPDNEIFCDGLKVYSYNKTVNEMNITLYDPKDDLVYTPQNLLEVYKKGYKYSYVADATFETNAKVNGKTIKVKKSCYVIDLYPENLKKSPFSLIRIWIDKNENELVSMKYQQKNGIEQIVDIIEFEHDVEINDDIFLFDKTKYPENLDIIDFTE